MTQGSKIITYWVVGIVGGLVVLVALAYVAGLFELAAPAAS